MAYVFDQMANLATDEIASRIAAIKAEWEGIDETTLTDEDKSERLADFEDVREYEAELEERRRK